MFAGMKCGGRCAVWILRQGFASVQPFAVVAIANAQVRVMFGCHQNINLVRSCVSHDDRQRNAVSIGDARRLHGEVNTENGCCCCAYEVCNHGSPLRLNIAYESNNNFPTRGPRSPIEDMVCSSKTGWSRHCAECRTEGRGCVLPANAGLLSVKTVMESCYSLKPHESLSTCFISTTRMVLKTEQMLFASRGGMISKHGTQTCASQDVNRQEDTS